MVPLDIQSILPHSGHPRLILSLALHLHSLLVADIVVAPVWITPTRIVLELEVWATETIGEIFDILDMGWHNYLNVLGDA